MKHESTVYRFTGKNCLRVSVIVPADDSDWSVDASFIIAPGKRVDANAFLQPETCRVRSITVESRSYDWKHSISWGVWQHSATDQPLADFELAESIAELIEFRVNVIAAPVAVPVRPA